MHGFVNILMNDVYYSSLQHEENDLEHWKQLHTAFVYWSPDSNYDIISAYILHRGQGLGHRPKAKAKADFTPWPRPRPQTQGQGQGRECETNFSSKCQKLIQPFNFESFSPFSRKT